MVVKQSSKNNGTRIFFKNAITTLLFTAPLSAPVLATNETVIDNNTAESVPGTRPNTWTLPGAIFIGENNTGSLTITQGGLVNSSTTNIDTKGSVLGYYSGSSGTVTVDGGTWYDGVDSSNNALSTGTTAVGGSGTGVLNILNGGKVALVFLNIGQNGNGNGSVVVDGAGSQLLATTDSTSGITVGNNGIGSVTIRNGGSVTSNSISYLGLAANAKGTVSVDGAGSSWVITNGSMVVGGAGTGALNITNGGLVKTAGGSIAGGQPW